jgi:hypothetical protein
MRICNSTSHEIIGGRSRLMAVVAPVPVLASIKTQDSAAASSVTSVSTSKMPSLLTRPVSHDVSSAVEWIALKTSAAEVRLRKLL